MQPLADRWRALIEAFTGGDPGIAASLKRMYAEEGPEKASRGAVNPELMEYAGRAHGAELADALRRDERRGCRERR